MLPYERSGIYLPSSREIRDLSPSSRGFMDDLTLTTATHVQARWMLADPDRCCFMDGDEVQGSKIQIPRHQEGIDNREVQALLTEPRDSIHSGKSNQVLGKCFDASLHDRDNVRKLERQVEDGLKKSDCCGLPGKFKAWLYQHALLPRLILPLMLYELMRYQTPQWKHWRESPADISGSGLESHHVSRASDSTGRLSKLQLPLSLLVEEFKVAKTRQVLTLRDSPDELIRDAGIETRNSRKWSATEAVKQAENTLKHKDIVGMTAVRCQGTGATNTVLWSRSDQKERRVLIQSEVRRAEEHARQARAVEMGAQGAWTTWNTTDRKLTWGDIWKYEALKFSFLLRSVYDLLPSPANLCQWGLTTDPKCSLCDKPGTQEHVLSSCSTALTQGRYRWRHDLVLRELADWPEKERKKEHVNNPQHGQIAFVKSGDTRKTQTAQPTLQNRSVGSSTAKPTLQNRKCRVIYPRWHNWLEHGS